MLVFDIAIITLSGQYFDLQQLKIFAGFAVFPTMDLLIVDVAPLIDLLRGVILRR